MSRLIVLLILSIIVTISIVSAYLYFAPISHYEQEPAAQISVNITPKIYSPENNIGVLNEQASFELYLYNTGRQPITVLAEIEAEGTSVYSENISISSYASRNTTINQSLTQTGDWLVRLIIYPPSTQTSDHVIIIGNSSYAFVTVTNSIDAKLQINALNEIQESKDSADQSHTLASQSNIISASSLIVSVVAMIVSIFRKPKESQ